MFSKTLIIIGLAFIAVGLAFSFRLPGDIVIERGNFKFYFPITTSILLSIIVSVILWLFRK